MKGSGIYEIHQQPAIVLSTGGVVGLLEVSNNMIAIYGNVVQWCKGILTVVTFSQLKRRLLARNIQQKGMFYIHNAEGVVTRRMLSLQEIKLPIVWNLDVFSSATLITFKFFDD